MLEVSIEVIGSYKKLKTFVKCPQCHKEDFFYNFITKNCLDCGFEWGNIITLMEDIRVRKHYHKEGWIN